MKKILITILTIAIAKLSFAFGTFKDSSEYYFDRAMAEKLANRSMIASKLFEKALDFNQTNEVIYIEAAHNLMEMHQPDKAKGYYSKAFEINPNNQKVIRELSILYYDFRQWDKAIEFATKCATYCDSKERVIGMSYYKKEDLVNAEKFLQKAILKDPNDVQSNYTLAKLYIDAEQERKALQFFEKAVSLNPKQTKWVYELALLYLTLGNSRAAVEKCELARSMGIAENNDFLENYGYALLNSGNFLKGEEEIMKLYKKKGNKEILRDLSINLYKLKQYDRCLDYCSKLIEADPKDGKALYQAGLSFIKLGKKEKGQGMCDKAIEIDPSLASKKTAIGEISDGL